MTRDNNEATAAATIVRRTSTIRVLAIIAAISGIAAVIFIYAGSPPKDATRSNGYWLSRLCLAIGAGAIWSSVVLNFLWGATSSARYYIAFLSSFFIFGIAMAEAPQVILLPGSLIVVCCAIALFLYENGLSIEVTLTAIKRIRRFPTLRIEEIPWNRVETVRADMRAITNYAGGASWTEKEDRVVLKGNGTTVALDTTRFKGGPKEVQSIIEQASPHAINATLQRIDTEGVARLGAIELRHDSIAWSRFAAHGGKITPWLVHVVVGILTFGLWFFVCGVVAMFRLLKGWQRVPLEHLVEVTLDQGNVVFVTGKKAYIPLTRIPNGIYLLTIIQSLRQNTVPAV